MEQTSPAILSLLSQTAPFLLTVFRLAGLFLFAPILTSSMVPVRYKAIMVFLLGAAVFPMISVKIPVGMLPVDVITMVPLLVREAMIGFTIGLIASIPMLSLEMSGVIAGQQMGLGLARVYNPDSDSEADVLGQMLYTIALGGFLAGHGVESMMDSVLETFSTIPLGGVDCAMAPLSTVTAVLTAGFELAIRVTTPVSGAVLLMTIVLGVIGKTMPQINIMSIGFTFKIAIGLLALIFGLSAVGDATAEVLRDTMRTVETWAGSPRHTAEVQHGG
jgi:flagellar biosynthetic protein FliR